MATTSTGVGIQRLQHLVLWVSDVERSVRFYTEVLGFEVGHMMGTRGAFLRIPGAGNDHDLALFEQAGVGPPDERVARMYHSAWQVGEITDLVRARERLSAAGALAGASNHGTSLSLYAKDPDGLEFEVFWAVPNATETHTRPLDLDAELARRGLSPA
jgi:catechol-2,3-dioxygenase